MADDWVSIRVGHACTKIGSGATPRGGASVYLSAGDVALIRSQNVYNDGFHLDGLVYLTKGNADQLANVAVEPNDVLLNITGDSVARCCQVDPRVLPARVNQHVAIVRPDPNVLDARYLRYFLVSPAMQAHLLSLAGAGATRNALTKGMIEAFEVPAPRDINEQHAIAAVLGALDDKIEVNRKKARVLEGIARAVFTSWFVDFDPVRRKAAGEPTGLPDEIAGLFPDRLVDSPMGEAPEGWRVGTLGEVAAFNARTLSRTDTLDADYIDYIEISQVMRGDIGEVTRYAFGSEPSRAKRRLTHGDTVISTVRPDRGAYFLCLNPTEALIASTGFAVMTAKEKDWAFLFIAATQSRVVTELGRLADGGAYPAVRPEVIAGLPLALPPESAPRLAFHTFAAPLLERAHVGRSQSTVLAGLRDALLPDLISGELRIADAERIVGRAV